MKKIGEVELIEQGPRLYTSRLRIEGGWIYRTHDHTADTLHTLFVADEIHMEAPKDLFLGKTSEEWDKLGLFDTMIAALKGDKYSIKMLLSVIKKQRIGKI